MVQESTADAQTPAQPAPAASDLISAHRALILDFLLLRCLCEIFELSTKGPRVQSSPRGTAEAAGTQWLCKWLHVE